MVMTSDQIAAQAGAFQQQVMLQNQYAGMLSQHAGAAPAGEQLMGHITNRGMGIGSAVLGGGLALAGLDPMSLGLKAGIAGWGAGGAMGAAGAAAGAFLPAYAAYQGVKYVGGQMMEGMGQQQALNATLRQNYQFLGQGAARGFSTGEMGSIGSMMRDMTGMRGPGGEFAQMDELTRLAGNMGRMGLAQGVRSAKEFSQKFQEMMTTVKEIATTFSTSLEQAQQVMVGMRQSGIFNNQSQTAQMIRQVAVGGGLATSEVTGMMTVGSQISRMIGGRGAAGAYGGARAIRDIGTMQQLGHLSEERLYNLTGLEGAEGRRALATDMMQISAQFLQSGRGRAFLASVAGRGGTLNEAAIQQYMHGGGANVMGMAHQNIAKMGGPAAFLRHQGRLRGEVLGRMGINAPLMFLRGALEQRGIDITNTEDPRANIVAQRLLGVSADQAEFLMQQVREQPLIEARQATEASADETRRNLERYRQHIGVAGVKRKLEGFKHGIESKLQKMGSDFYQEGSNALERFVMAITGDFEVIVDRDLGGAVRDLWRTGGIGAEADRLKASRFGGRGDILGGQALGGKGIAGVKGVGFGGVPSVSSFMKLDAERYKAAGYDVAGMSGMLEMTQADLKDRLARTNEMSNAFLRGVGRGEEGEVGERINAMGRDAQVEIRRMLASDRLSGKGQDQLAQFSELLRTSKNEELRALAGDFMVRGRAGQMAMLGSMTRRSGVDWSVMTQAPDETMLGGLAIQGTREDMELAIGRQALLGTGLGEAQRQKLQGGMEKAERVGEAIGEGTFNIARWQAGMMTLGGTEVANLLSGGKLMEGGKAGAKAVGKGLVSDEINKALKASKVAATSDPEAQAAYGRMLMSEKGRDVLFGAFSKDEATRKAAIERLTDESLELKMRARQEGRELTATERGETILFNQNVGAASEMAALAQNTKGGLDAVPEGERRAWEEQHGMSWEQGKTVAGQMIGRLELAQQMYKFQLKKDTIAWGKDAKAKIRAAGAYEEGGGFTKEAVDRFKGIGAQVEAGTVTLDSGEQLGAASQGEVYLRYMQEATNAAERGDTSLAQSYQEKATRLKQGLSTAELGKLATAEAATGIDNSGTKAQQQNLQGLLRAGGGRVGKQAGGAESVMGRALGLKDLTKYQKLSPTEAARVMASDLGVAGKEDVIKDLESSFQSLREGGAKGQGEAAGALGRVKQKITEEKAAEAEKAEQAKTDKSNAALATAIAKAISEQNKADGKAKAVQQIEGEVKAKVTGEVKVI